METCSLNTHGTSSHSKCIRLSRSSRYMKQEIAVVLLVSSCMFSQYPTAPYCPSVCGPRQYWLGQAYERLPMSRRNALRLINLGPLMLSVFVYIGSIVRKSLFGSLPAAPLPYRMMRKKQAARSCRRSRRPQSGLLIEQSRRCRWGSHRHPPSS